MARSIKKGPYIEGSLMRKVENISDGSAHKVIKTWSRRSTIHPDFVGMTLSTTFQEHVDVEFGKEDAVYLS